MFIVTCLLFLSSTHSCSWSRGCTAAAPQHVFKQIYVSKVTITAIGKMLDIASDNHPGR